MARNKLVNIHGVRIGGDLADKKLIRQMNKVLEDGVPFGLYAIFITGRKSGGGSFGAGTIKAGCFKTFLHELAHAQRGVVHCKHSGRRYCGCSHDELFHRKAFTLYAKYLRGKAAQDAREQEYAYHTNIAGKVAGEFRKRSEFLRWKRGRRNRKTEAKVQGWGQPEDGAAEEARRLNIEAAKSAMEYAQKYNSSWDINWVSPKHLFRKEDGTWGKYYTRRNKFKVTPDGKVINKFKKVCLDLSKEAM
jgi:hypothetical protein